MSDNDKLISDLSEERDLLRAERDDVRRQLAEANELLRGLERERTLERMQWATERDALRVAFAEASHNAVRLSWHTRS